MARGDFVGGEKPSVADFFIASDLYALDLDPGRNTWFEGLPGLSAWLERLRGSRGYDVSHRPWNAILPRLRELLASGSASKRDCHWVAGACKMVALD